MPVNGSLRYDDYVQPRAPGTRLSRDPIAKQKRGLKQIKTSLFKIHSRLFPLKLRQLLGNERER